MDKEKPKALVEMEKTLQDFLEDVPQTEISLNMPKKDKVVSKP